MKKIIYLLMCVLLVSCGSNKEEVIKAADSYVASNLLSLFPEGKIVKKYRGMAENDIKLIKDPLVRLKLLNIYDESLLDAKQFYANNFLNTDNEEKRKQELIKFKVLESTIAALNESDTSKGFYLVTVGIEHSGDRIKTVDVVLSADLKVLNKPISLSE